MTRTLTPGHWFITEMASVLSFSLHLWNIETVRAGRLQFSELFWLRENVIAENFNALPHLNN